MQQSTGRPGSTAVTDPDRERSRVKIWNPFFDTVCRKSERPSEERNENVQSFQTTLADDVNVGDVKANSHPCRQVTSATWLKHSSASAAEDGTSLDKGIGCA